MAYVSQERKAELAPVIKAVLKKYGVKGSIAVRHHSTLVLNIKSGPIDFIGNYNKMGEANREWGHDKPYNTKDEYLDVNVYHYTSHFDGEALAFLTELIGAMQKGNHDRSDIQSDYFDVGWYIDVNIGSWDKPYILETKA